MINLKKNDPVAESIKQIIEKDLSPKQKRIAALAGDKNSIDALDLAALRAGKKPTSEEIESVEENAFDYKSPRPSEPNGGSGVKKGTRYGGSKQKDKPEQDDDKMKKEDVEQIDEAFEDLTPSKHGNFSVNSKVKSPKEGFHKGEHVGMDTLIHKGTIQHKDNSKPTKFEVHNHVNRGLTFQTHHSDEEKQAIKQHLVKNKYAGKGTDIHEEVEQIDEISKSTLGSYVKGAARDVGASRKLAADFQNAADKSRRPAAKTANSNLSKKFNAVAHKRHAGIGKAVERLTKENTMLTLKQMKENYEESILDEMINEVLSKDATAGDWIHDFVHSDNPKFAGKSKAQRKKQALAAYYAKQRNEEVVEEGLKDAVKTVAKKAFKALTGGSDKDHLERLKKDMKKEEVVTESKGPTSQQDEPFVTSENNVPLNNAKTLAAKTMKRMKNEMIGKTGTSE